MVRNIVLQRNIRISAFKRISAKVSKVPVCYLQEKAVLLWTQFLEESPVDLKDTDMT